MEIFSSNEAPCYCDFHRIISGACAIVLALAVLLTGCGVPGEPLPPLLEIPAPAKDLTATQEGATILLKWFPIQLSTEGTRVGDFFDRIEIYGAFLPPGESLKDFAAQAHVVANTRDMLPMTLTARSGLVLALTADRVGKRAFFGIKAINRKGRDAGFSNIASLPILDAPKPPENLAATLTERAIRLNWRAATLSAFGGPPPPAHGYRITRFEISTSSPPEQIGEAEDTSYNDTTFQFGHTYYYVVRAFVRDGDSVAVTPDSQPVKVEAVDTFPPAAPRNLRAIAVPGSVELAWSPNDEPDLAGYNVYRKNGELFTRLNAELLRIPTFRDLTPTPGEQIVYVVKAADKPGNESTPSVEASVTTE